MKPKIDLHMHSSFSDGTKTPKELVQMAKNIGLGTIALTDHDNIEGSKEIINYNSELINIYSGVELSVKTNKGTMHILGYNIELENEALNNVLKEMHENALYNMQLYINVLKKDFNIAFTDEAIKHIYTKKGNVGRPELALLLIKMGICQTVDEAFAQYLNYAFEKVRSQKKSLTKEEAIELIINAGGVASLAHPSSLKLSNEELEKEIVYLKNIGLRALEIIHPNNHESLRTFLLKLAKKYDLLISGGTDFHGIEIKPDIQLGYGRNNNVTIDEDFLTLTKKIKNRYKKDSH